MNIEIKKSKKPVKYEDAIKLMEKRVLDINDNKSNELIWILEHENLYTAGTSYRENEIIDKKIKIVKSNRGGKITYHGPGQLICYFVIDLRSKKDIRKFITCIEKTIIETLKNYGIDTFSDKNNIGIWHKRKNIISKVAAIGVRVKKWIAYHGFSININNNLDQYKKIIPCGLNNNNVTSVYKEKKILIKNFEKKLITIFKKNFYKI